MKILGPNRVDNIPADLGVILNAYGEGRMPAVITEGADVDTATYLGLKTPSQLVANAILSEYPTAMAGNYSLSSTAATPTLSFNPDGTNVNMTPGPLGAGLCVFGVLITIQGSTAVGAPAVTFTCTGMTGAVGATQAKSTVAANAYGNTLDNTISIRPPDLRGAGTFLARVLWLPGYQVQGGFAYSPILVRGANAQFATPAGNAATSFGVSVAGTSIAAGVSTHVTLLTRGCPEVDNLAASYLRGVKMQRSVIRRLTNRG